MIYYKRPQALTVRELFLKLLQPFIFIAHCMIVRLINLVKLIQILRERGNWPLIRHSRRQLRDFIFCRSGMNRKSLFSAAVYWLYMLKGLDVLVWRLETFGFLYQLGQNEESRQRLNSYL